MTSSDAARPARLVATTRETGPVEDLLAYADPSAPLVWLRRGDGFVGVGETLRIDATRADGPVAARWRDAVDDAVVDDPVGLPGTGLIAFGAFPFDPQSTVGGALVVPSVVLGRSGDRFWTTTIHREGEPAPAPPAPTGYGPYWAATLGPGQLDPEGYENAVRGGLDAIAAGEVSKVVLARELVGTIPAGSDLRRLARALSTGYPDTWAYAVDGLIGASPETLISVADGVATARVLAGTAARGADPDADAAASLALATSAKDLDEHQYAVQSVLASLRPYAGALSASEQPFTLKLPNVWHLATDIEAGLADSASSLDLVAALHPTAAVAGTPTDAAIAAIRRLEPFDRGRYAGPVGWIDAGGDGEWAIALRCAQIGAGTGADTLPVTAHAGAGIVAGSDPEAELLETRVKFRPIVDALA